MFSVELEWQDDLYFEAQTASGHTVKLEAGASVGVKVEELCQAKCC